MTTKQITKLEHLVYSSELEIEQLTADLARECAHLADRLDRVARTLSMNPAYGANPLGEVQNKGREIDRLCALLDAEKRKLVLLKHLDD